MLASSEVKNILVLGVGRSGTSSIYNLLQEMLEDQFPGQTDFVYEPFHWDRQTFNKRYSEYSTEFQNANSVSVDGIYHHKRIPLFCSARSKLPNESSDWLQKLFVKADNKPNTLAKMIRANGRVGLINELIPNLKIVAIFRNPLEVINSSINMFSFFGDDFYKSDYDRFLQEANNSGKIRYSKCKIDGDPIERELQYWQAMNQHLAQQISRDNSSILPILHEQFTSNREDTVRQICRYAGLDFRPSYVIEAGKSVGPLQKTKNNLSVKQYLFLEDKLSEYKTLASGFSSFDLNDQLTSIKERFITSNFPSPTGTSSCHFNSLYAKSRIDAQEQSLEKLRTKVADFESMNEMLSQHSLTIQQNDEIIKSHQMKIQDFEQKLKDNESIVRVKNEEIVRKEAIILQKERELAIASNGTQSEMSESAELSQMLKQQENELGHREKQITKREQSLIDKNATLRKRELDLAKFNSDLKSKSTELSNKDSESVKRETDLKEKIRELTAKVGKANDRTDKLNRVLKAKEEQSLRQEQNLATANEKLLSAKSKLQDNDASFNNQLIRCSELELLLTQKQQELNEQEKQLFKLTEGLHQSKRLEKQTQQKLDQSTNQLVDREKQFNHQQLTNNHLMNSLKNDICLQSTKLSQMDDLLTDLRKVKSYPVSQIDRKLRAFKKLIKTYEQVKPSWHNKKHPGYTSKYLAKLKQTVSEQGVNLGDQLEAFYGNHRSGWAFAVSSLSNINKPQGIYLDTFIERTFCWAPDGVKPHTQPWIGFIHVPPFVPGWFQYNQANHAIFETDAWQKSLPHCKGLFTLSKYHRDFLQPRFDFPVESVIHPTEIPDQLWSWKSFEQNQEKRIVQLGWWLRKLHAIYQLPGSAYKKTLIKTTEKQYLTELFDKEKAKLVATGEFNDGMYDSVEVLGFLPNNQYDQLLSKNIVFLNLYDSSANNSVIECIARGTPLLVNKIPAVVEYLGEDYPFYYDSMNQAVEKAADFDLVRQTHTYLLDSVIRKKLTGEYFANSILESKLLLNVYQDNLEISSKAA